MALRRSSMLVALATALACTGTGSEADGETGESGGTGGTGGAEFVSLIDQAQWQELDAAADPLAAHRPDPVECALDGWRVEEDTLEIETTACNYVGLHQPSLVELVEGRTVQLIFYHFDLTAPEATTGHVAILVEGEVLWEVEVDIPGMANVWDIEFPSPISAPAGSEVVFHLHNHGQNTWALQDLMTWQPN